MGDFDIRGESDALSDKQVTFLCDVLKKRGFKGNKVTIETLGKAGDNYCANVKRITVDNGDGTTFKIIAKVALTNEFLRNMMSTEVVFANEMIMYEEVFPKFQELEIAADIPDEDRFTFPACYGTYNEPLHEMVLLEDLSEENYVMLDRFKFLKNEEVILILKSFAKFHALSFVLRKKDNAMYKEFTEKLIDNFTRSTMEIIAQQTFASMVENINSLLSSDEHKKIIETVFKEFINEARKIKEFDTGSLYSAIIHGDAWINNILFKLERVAVQECILIDYQLSNEKSPVYDLHYLINNCTDYKTRTKHFKDWINLYHEELGKRLSYFDIQINYAYPKEKMLLDYKRYTNFAVGCSILLSNALSLDTKEATRLKEVMNTSENYDEMLTDFKLEDLKNGTLKLFVTKIEGLLNTFYTKPIDYS